MSWATDPYQPAESRLRITRSVLEVFRDQPVGLLVIQTRSPLVERDFDLLADMPFACLSMTVETDDDDVRRALTPTCPSIERRFATMREARARGIRVQAAISPTLLHDTDRFADLLGDLRAELRARDLHVDAETWSRALDARLRALVAQRRLDEARRRLLERLGVAEAVGAD